MEGNVAEFNQVKNNVNKLKKQLEGADESIRGQFKSFLEVRLFEFAYLFPK